MTKKILFLSPYPYDKAPSQRLKYEQYYPHIREAGYEIFTSSFISDRFWDIIYTDRNTLLKVYYTLLGYLKRVRDLLRIRKFDIVYVHLWVTPIGLPLFEQWVIRLSRNLIYDIDDLVYLNDQRNTNHVMNLIRGRSKPITLMKGADHIICCTPRLEAFVRKFNSHVTDISSTINTDVYVPANKSKKKDHLVIGWSGSHSTSRYLHLLDEVFQKLAKEIDFTLKVIGDPYFRIEGVNVKAIPWCAENEVEELQEFDIGVYPLPLDEEWVHGKSGLKALQYMALGIPTLATAIGANFRIIEDGDNGFLIDQNSNWEEKIISLVRDPGLAKSLRTKARKTVEDLFSVKVNAKIYLSILKNL